MARDESSYTNRVFPCLIDRLLGFPEYRRSSGFVEAFCMDLEWLLNAHADRLVKKHESGSNLFTEYPEVATSVLNYGITDLSGRSFEDADLRWLEVRIIRAISHFEPRVEQDTLRVTARQENHLIDLQIEGKVRELHLAPTPFNARFKVDIGAGKSTFYR